MKQEDKKYEELLNVLKTSSPILHQPEDLTEKIIGKIESLPRKKNRYLLVGSWVSGLAATFLLCLLVKETVFSSSSEEQRMLVVRQELKTLPYAMEPDKQTKKYIQTASFFSLKKGDKELPLSEIGRKISAFIRQQQDADAKKMLAIKKQIEITLK